MLSYLKLHHLFLSQPQDPNSKTHKYVLINWAGEGAPVQRKAVAATHVSDVAKFFHGAHVTINARNEKDLDSEAILKQVCVFGSPEVK